MDPVERTILLARAALSPSSADDGRARRSLGLSPNSLAASAATAPAGVGVWAALRASGTAGAAIGAMLVGLGFAGGYWVGHRESPAPAVASLPAPLPATAHVAPARHATPASAPDLAELDGDDNAPAEGGSERVREVSPAPLDSPRSVGAGQRSRLPGRSKAPARASAPADARVPDPSEELALLRRIERSLRAEQPALALALLGELEDRFPETRLDEERAAVTVLVHCALHDPGARRRAEAFLSERAASVYADRVRWSCSLPALDPPRLEAPRATGRE